MKKKIFKTAVLAVCVMCTSTVMSQEDVSKKQGKQRFGKMDTNGDKQVSREEFLLSREMSENQSMKEKDANKRFDAMDTDSDGFLSREEFKARKKKNKEGKK